MKTILAISLVAIPVVIAGPPSGPSNQATEVRLSGEAVRQAGGNEGAGVAARPRWHREWPSLDEVVPSRAEEFQKMGTGEADYSIPGSPDFSYPSCTGDRCTPGFNPTCTGEPCTPVSNPPLCTGDRCPPVSNPPSCTGDRCPPVSNPPSCTGDRCPPVSNPPSCTGDRCAPPVADPLPTCSGPGCPPYDPPVCSGGLPSAPPTPPAGDQPADGTYGYRLLSPDGQPLDNVALGQPFNLELRVRPGDATGPTLSVVLRTADGAEDRITLEQFATGPTGVVYRTPQPVSIGGEAGRMDYDGTINGLGLEFDAGSEVYVVQLTAGNILGGTSAVRVYANPIQQGIAANTDLLNQVAAVLQAERQVAEGMLANPEVAKDPAMVNEVKSWLRRIESREYLVQQGRTYIANAQFPIYQLRYSSFFLSRLLTTGPNGLQVAEDAPTAVALMNDLGALNRQLQNEYGTNGIVPPAAMGVIAGYVIGGTTTFAHVTMAAAFTQLLTGKDLFGNEASRGWAAVEIGAGLAMIFLPPKIIDFLAGRGLDNFGFEISIGGKPTHIYPVKLAAAIEGGRAALTGGRRATPRPPGTGELPAGASVSDLPARRQGLSSQDAQLFKGHVDKARPTNPTAQTKDLEFMMYQNEKDALANLDNAIATARGEGMPQVMLDNLLTRARDITGREGLPVGDAAEFVIREVEFWVTTKRGDRILVAPDDMGAMQGWYTADQMAAARVTSCDLGTAEGVIVKARLEASGKQQSWTPDEIVTLRELDRRIAGGEDLATWKRADVRETGNPDAPYTLDGFEPVFTSGDLGAIRAAAARPLRITTEGITSSGGVNLPPPAGGGSPFGGGPVNPIDVPAQFGGPSGLGNAQGQFEIVFRGTGGSTGEVLEAAVVNYGGPIRFQTSGLVLEPASPDQVQQSSSRLDEIFKALHGGGTINQQVPAAFPGDGSARSWEPSLIGPNEQGLDGSAPESGLGATVPMRGRVVRLVLDAYCLEFLKAVPAAGTVFRIASQAQQKTNARLRSILAASRQLQQAAGIHPDGNPASYFHSLRQWAIWVEERKLDQGKFEADFLRHAQRNFAAAGRAWTGEVEGAVRALLPNRWRDIRAVLQAADSPSNR